MITIEQQGKILLDEFSKVSTGLFEITNIYNDSFEQGSYICAFAKPTKRMRNALSIDREVLVVVSTFTDQQQRTVKFALQQIKNSTGRLETTMAIILHRDKDGNIKLKNWGRDAGISILPVFDGDSLNSETTLERALCIELYSHDPFDVTGPVSDDANFYGRRDEAIEFARKLQSGQIRSCLGIRKIGKTSIINRILREINTSHDCICLMIDCSRDDIWSLDASSLINSISETTKHLVSTGEKYKSLDIHGNIESLSAGKRKLEESIREARTPIILIFDEIDYITPGSPTNPSWKEQFNIFWRNLRAVYQEASRENLNLSILIAGVSTYWFTVESIDGIENAALAFVPEEYLTPMPTGAVIAMLRRLGKTAGIQFDDHVAEKISDATGKMPYWARKCSSYINRMIPVSERPCTISIERVEQLISSFIKEEGSAIAQVALRHLFRVYPNLKLITEACYQGRGADVPERDKRVLRRYGVISETRDTLSGMMMTSGFQLILEENQINTSSNLPSRDSTNTSLLLDLDEWAEELATIGKRRNVLEKRMRELALNFIRFEALSKGTSDNASIKLLNVIPSSQRSKFSHLTANEIINKFNWTDLVLLISKEWHLFEKIFGNNNLFKNNCDIINDRFDAHAKDADPADIALYRRALKQLEEQIAKIQ